MVLFFSCPISSQIENSGFETIDKGSTYGSSYKGSHFTLLAITKGTAPNALKESIHYTGFNFECGIPYNRGLNH